MSQTSEIRNPKSEIRNEPALVLSAHSLGKMYHLYDRPRDRLKQAFLWGRKQLYHEFWALRDISFELRRGEMLGIIGRNGSGKSTLLQIIAGVLRPTTGEVQVRGRVAALLELGSGFNPEFTGRENVFLNGAILGVPRKEVERRFDEIAAFADVGEFMEQPVKTYSSGMMVRLAFAVQACIEPDLLIVDEALSVGDIFFRQKCHTRIELLLAKGTAVILVTHDMAAVQRYCHNALLLETGSAAFGGTAHEAIQRYYSSQLGPRGAPDGANSEVSCAPRLLSPRLKRPDELRDLSSWPQHGAFIESSSAASIGDGWARCRAIALGDAEGRPQRIFEHGQRAYFYYEFEALQDLLCPFGAIVVKNSTNILVHGKATYQHLARSVPYVRKGARIRVRHCIVLNLRPEEYTFDVALSMMAPDDYARLEDMSAEEIQSKITRLNYVAQAGSFSVTPATDKLALPHFGICDLPGDCETEVVA